MLGLETLVVILLSVNRLSSLTLGYVAPNEFLRWVDVNNLLPLPLISLAGFWLVKRILTADAPRSWGMAGVDLLFVLGAYITGAGYGVHEVTNYLHARFCATDSSTICQIIVFNDDEFSHWVFFAGFVMTSLAMLLICLVAPRTERLSRLDLGLLTVNALFIGLGVFANLAFEEIGLDLYVVAILALASLLLLRLRGTQPMTVYFGVAFWFGLIATAAWKLTH